MSAEVWITGYGLVSPLGASPEEHWARLSSRAPTVQPHPRCGYAYHPIVGFDPSAFVQRRADVRQMGDLMLYAVGAAALALRSAGLAPGAEALARLQICIAADGGERDVPNDEVLLSAVLAAADPDAKFNEHLMRARPSHFLTQLPNLIPSNICIVQGFAAPSRTLMGTEATSVEALRDAVQRIRAGQGELFLVGSSKNADDTNGMFAFGRAGLMSHDPVASVWAEDGRGFNLGSASGFVVVESRAHAEARGARPLARIAAVDTSFAARDESTACEDRLLARWREAVPEAPATLGVLSGITGQGALARRERNFLAGVEGAGTRVAARATALLQGHAVEAAFFANLILGILCLERRALFPPLDAREPWETAALDGALERVLVTSWGTNHAEGFAQLEALS